VASFLALLAERRCTVDEAFRLIRKLRMDTNAGESDGSGRAMDAVARRMDSG